MPEGELGGAGAGARPPGSGRGPSVETRDYWGPVACEERAVRFRGGDPGQGGQQVKAGAEAGGGAPLNTEQGLGGLGGSLLARCQSLWLATHGALPPGVARPAGWEGLPMEVRQLKRGFMS